MTNGRPWPFTNPRPCAGCLHRHTALGMAYCGLDKWAGLTNEKSCGAPVPVPPRVWPKP